MELNFIREEQNIVENLKAMRQDCYGILERRLEEIVSTAEVIRCSNANTPRHLLDFTRGYLLEDELAPYKVDAWNEELRGENETIPEPSDWREKQNEFSPSSRDLPDAMDIAHRMGTLQQEFPLLCRTGIIAADPDENI